MSKKPPFWAFFIEFIKANTFEKCPKTFILSNFHWIHKGSYLWKMFKNLHFECFLWFIYSCFFYSSNTHLHFFIYSSIHLNTHLSFFHLFIYSSNTHPSFFHLFIYSSKAFQGLSSNPGKGAFFFCHNPWYEL